MAGPVEEGAKVASSVVDAMKGQPMMLAIIVINIIFLGAVGWGTTKARDDFMATIHLLIEKQDKTAQMLYNCVPANKTGIHFDLLNNPYVDPLPPPTTEEGK